MDNNCTLSVHTHILRKAPGKQQSIIELKETRHLFVIFSIFLWSYQPNPHFAYALKWSMLREKGDLRKPSEPKCKQKT